jgi:hypothetical protein
VCKVRPASIDAALVRKPKAEGMGHRRSRKRSTPAAHPFIGRWRRAKGEEDRALSSSEPRGSKAPQGWSSYARQNDQRQRRYFLFAAASFLICSITGPRSFSAAASSALSCSGGQRRSVCWMAWNIGRVSGNGAQP